MVNVYLVEHNRKDGEDSGAEQKSDYRVREVRREGKFRMMGLSGVTHEHMFTRVSHEQ